MDIINKKIGILGFGEENQALVKYLLKNGAKDIVICDQRREDELAIASDLKKQVAGWRLGPDYLDNLTDFEIVFRTPGLPYLDPKIQKAKENGVVVSSEIKLFFEQCPSPIIGVTGTKGKGTTATLIYKILKQSGKDVRLAGNIGNAPIEFLDEVDENNIIVLELSSFQLQDLEQSPHIGVVLNITSDHLDIHKSNEEYIEAKTNIIKHQNKNDFAVINADYMTSFQFAAMTEGQVFYFSRQKSVDQGSWVKDDIIYLRENDEDVEVIKTADLELRGRHNWENISAAVVASRLAGADLNSIRHAVKSFKGLEHRLEFVAEINGVKYYNDSFSTNPETAIAAIKSFDEPTVLIAGGSTKHADFIELSDEINRAKLPAVILIGDEGERLKEALDKTGYNGMIYESYDFKEAVKLAKIEAERAHGIVLLSPACASFDMFKNYKDRGDQFKEIVKTLK